MLKKIVFLVGVVGAFISCSSDDNTNTNDIQNLELSLTKLQNLGSDFVYEGWIIVNGAPQSTGVFSVDDDGKLSKTTFELKRELLNIATAFVLTIEAKGETGQEALTPSKTKILSGNFSDNSASLNTGIIGSFSSASGSFILATPTDNANGVNNMNDENGVWFLNPTTTPPSPSLSLPVLDEGWQYEGWVITNGTPLSTGTFTNVAATDNSAPFSGPVALPSPNGSDGFFPGEDFLINAPSEITFPLDLRGKTVVITIEPNPDNNPKPFSLKPLIGTAGQLTVPNQTSMTNNSDLSFPGGLVKRLQ